MDPLGWAHTLAAAAAILLGMVIVRTPKGTRRHRAIGRSYVACSAVVCGSAFALYNLYGTFGPFHWASVAQIGCLAAGLIPLARRARSQDRILQHAFYMSWSYIGLLAALAGEITSRVPGAPFDWAVWTSVLCVVFMGSRVIKATFGRPWRIPAEMPARWNGLVA